MLSRKSRRRRLSSEEINPMDGVRNLIDVMLVFAVGLLVSLVLSWNMQNIIFARVNPQEKQRLLQSIQKTINVEQGKELEEVPQLDKGGGSGYREMGTVYRDAKTGKLIMIESGENKNQ
ncbi:MAG: DUF2149 domain-containing protein [Actinobacteria bacterium]|nr:DUF2149 domain-containing protein [Actinomycetota bacterium]